jgi:NADH:ubiquinone reductase (H+-translocating)
MSRPNIVIVGGGFAGFWAAAAARRVGGDDLDITLVSSGPTLQIRPRLYESGPAMMGVELAPLLSTLNVSFVVDTAASLDVTRRFVMLDHSPALAYERLVVAVGSVMRRPPIDGIENAFSIDTQAEAVTFETHLDVLAAGQRSRPITVAVIGAGFTGIELGLELRDRIGAIDRRAGEEMRIVLIDRNDTVGCDLGPNPKPAIDAALIEARIETRLSATIVRVSASSVTFNDGTVLETNAIVMATGLQASPFVEQVPGQRDQLGRLIVDRSLRAPDAPDVFVTGDAAAADTGDGHLALQSCQHALQLGRFAGENAARDLFGLATIDYSQSRYVTCLDLGRSGAVLTTGWDRNVVMSGRDAKVVKQRINTEIIYPPVNADRATLLQLSAIDQG